MVYCKERVTEEESWVGCSTKPHDVNNHLAYAEKFRVVFEDRNGFVQKPPNFREQLKNMITHELTVF